MSVGQLRENGFGGVTMSYEEGGRIEVWTWRGVVIRVDAPGQIEEVKRLLTEASPRVETIL